MDLPAIPAGSPTTVQRLSHGSAAARVRDAQRVRSRVHAINGGEHLLLIQLDPQRLVEDALGLLLDVLRPGPQCPRRATVLLAGRLA
jgi:hypothetical protein